jgi:CRP-like cAMP-binding protein
MTGACKAPQIFGLYESLDGIQAHTATIEALTPCWLLEVSAKEYLSCLENETQIMRYSLRYLAAFIGRILNKNDQMLLNTPRQICCCIFTNDAGGAQFPVRLPVEKAALAEELNLNLRNAVPQTPRVQGGGDDWRRKGKSGHQ